jgi:glyoxylase-like metal-dependent hydrolase (beta-lactamase superfamily II)
VAGQVAPGVVRLGTSLVNWYLVDDGDGLTLVDAGLPGYWPQLPVVMEALGRRVGDLHAVVLTHGHVDHIGVAERARREGGARILVHEADAELVRTGRQPKREASVLPYLWRPAALRFFFHFAHVGIGLRRPAELETFGGGDVLDVPGRPRVIHAPGHSEGSCALHFEAHGVLFAGDVLVTLNVLTGQRGPQIPPAPFSDSSARALESLARIEPVEAPLALFGHGEPWTAGVAAAVARVREFTHP